MNNLFLITPRDLQAVRKAEHCYSIESMPGHGAEGRNKEYIGSRLEDSGKVWDYFVDDVGWYWYRTRWRKPDGKIISDVEHLEINIKRKKHRQ